MKRSAALVCTVLATAALVAGCSSSGSPARHGGTGTGASTGATALAGRIDAALGTLTSAHLDIDTGALGGTSTADLVLQDGNASATEIHVTESGTAVEVVTVGTTAWVKLPNGSAKPWVLVSPTSSNPIAKALATEPGVTDALTSLSTIAGLVRHAQDVSDMGTDATGHRYAMKIIPGKGTGNAKLDSLLSILGNNPIATDIWLDTKNRPVKVQLDIAFGGSQFPVTVVVSKLNAPLTITAPPADAISSG
ncbi:MAG: hypothetical protein EPN43_00585 [Jatrophihabitans sp.]|nr:MAG: hypothetical protein EPN43_00585 [Jatrophihabitans sp.]